MSVYGTDLIGCPVKDNGHVYRSNYNGYNVWRPTDYAAFWDDLGTVEEVQG